MRGVLNEELFRSILDKDSKSVAFGARLESRLDAPPIAGPAVHTTDLTPDSGLKLLTCLKK